MSIAASAASVSPPHEAQALDYQDEDVQPNGNLGM